MQKLRIALYLTVLLLATNNLVGQSGATGTILGTVTDATGAVVSGAKVTITNTGTNLSSATVTTSSGDYNVIALNPGAYRVTVEARGFQKEVISQLTLTVDQKLRANALLRPGAISQVVEVNAQAVVLDTDSAAQSTLMSSQQVANLPLNGRNFMQLLLVTPGAVTVGGEQGTMRQGVGNAVSVNGGRPEGNNYTLDGLINTDPALVTPAVILSQDAIQEFKVDSGTYSAENGFSATQINLVSKGGTNSIHGALFWFNRSGNLAAKPFATAADYGAGRSTTVASLVQNQFGFVADGPVYIPKVYDGRNKTFWMANYEGWRISNGALITGSTPNPATLAGNFNNETSLAGGPLPAFGSAACATALSKTQNCMPVDPLTGLPFPNNTIPAARITNRLAQVAVAYNFFPAPTVLNQPEGGTNFFQNTSFPLTTNQQTYRVDQNLGRYGSIFGRGTYSKYQNHFLSQSINSPTGLLVQLETQKNWEVSHTISFGTSITNNFRFGYLDAQAPQGGVNTPPDAAVAALGINNAFTQFSPLQLTWPSINLTQYSIGGGSINAYTGSDSPSWEFADSLSWVHGKHSLGFGIDYRKWRLIRNTADDFLGDWSFNSNNIINNNESGSCPNPTHQCGTGNAIADLLLGYYSNIAGFVPGALSPTTTAGNPQTHPYTYIGPYVKDDWKVTQNLTLFLGLRWDYRSAPYEVQNHFFWRDLTNPTGGLCYADPALSTNGVADQYIRYCGKNPGPGSKLPFAPRFGFAYRPNEKTVVRGGYGIFFDSFEGREIDNSGDIYPYSVRLASNPTGDPTLPKLGNNMFPNYKTLGPFPNPVSFTEAVIQSPDPHNPYIQSITLSVERQLARNTTLEVSYIGNHGTHLLDRRNIAQALPITAANLPFCQANPTDATHSCPVVNRRPFPNFSFYIDSDFHGYSHYDAGNVKFNRSSGDLALTAIYTWAKSMDDKSAAAGVGATAGYGGFQGFMNNQNPSLDYARSDFNVGQRFVASYIYQLPIGTGKKFLGSVNRGVDFLVGGWQITGITTFQSGFPFTVGASDAFGLNNTFGQRANYVPGCNINAGISRFQRLNPSCFTQPAAGTFGNTGRGFLTQPGLNNWDMGVSKYITIYERARLEFRFDSFNTFNHHQYNVNVGGLATGGSGGASSISSNVNGQYFGQITSSGTPRALQLSGKLTF
jgi:Carboxypeptidase regulatory-like domain